MQDYINVLSENSKEKVKAFLDNHTLLRKEKNNYYLKSNSDAPLFRLGQTALWVAHIFWYGKLTNSGSGSGDTRLFYEFAYLDLLDRIIQKVDIVGKNIKITNKKENIEKDFKK